MSLLIGARGKNFVVLIADGFSLRIQDKKSKVERRDLKKIFPIGDHPCVMAHHGQNEIGGLTVESVLTGNEFQRVQSRVWNQGLNAAMAKTVSRLDSSVSQTLKSSPQRGLFGLWFAGFWPCTPNPEITELAWQHSAHNRVRIAMIPHKHLVIGGSGMKHLRDYLGKPLDQEFSADKIASAPVEYSMEFVKKLYDVAIERQKQSGEKHFGGVRRMAVITPDGVDIGPTN
jgi:hypothetical protein